MFESWRAHHQTKNRPAVSFLFAYPLAFTVCFGVVASDAFWHAMITSTAVIFVVSRRFGAAHVAFIAARLSAACITCLIHIFLINFNGNFAPLDIIIF